MPKFLMMVWLLLGASAEAGDAPQKVALGPIEAHCRSRLHVLGFADNERAMAVMQEVRCPVSSHLIDHYTMIDLLETAHHTVVARYRGGPVTRTTRAGKQVYVAPQALAQIYAHWRRAQAFGQWLKIKKAGHFRLKKHDFADVLVRIRREANSSMDVHAEGKSLVFTAPRGTPVNCTVMSRLVDGTEISLGKIYDDTPGSKKKRGTLEVAFSAHGHLVALLHHGLRDETLTLTRTAQDNPIASTQVGFMQMLKWDADSVKELYVDMHPEGKKVWEEMVGVIE